MLEKYEYIGICLLDVVIDFYVPRDIWGIVPNISIPIVFLAYVLHNIEILGYRELEYLTIELKNVSFEITKRS